ncbi:MoaD/ThiS family protein [Leptospira wolffii]|uniref:Molybdopterin synthase sulfur carrier subunit n=1 Tax=Leptospira wolffii TaxID=409998 RepID=A0A2M9Z7T9_9LEPT|nr:MoaD/ThiS family protein [Leptospira wolffii]PJZ64392.1 molybdopterin synthase sulfur carrier subunit [Leptospira wolffii]TGK54800.1 MoaD/ThiS family protein [Leptospira wolffii]TGK65712.1 MoaD/ThiS family protein [Leptospira wolffii]TGK70722.1 MoaD/ThiS family protein [Leptospira wolffii]TGL26469.1 MoaD/ThiS family protein [Leptospira wolffii]
MNIELYCFAAMKDYFPARDSLSLEKVETVADLRNHLAVLKPDSSDLLRLCRFAINHTIVADEVKLFDGATVAVLPPSSGG